MPRTGPGGSAVPPRRGNAPSRPSPSLRRHEGRPGGVRLTHRLGGRHLLLFLGFSLLAGGRGQVDRFSCFLSLGLVGVAIVLFAIPAVPSWDGAPERDLIVYLSLVVSIVLLLVYVATTWSRSAPPRMHTSSGADRRVALSPLTRRARNRDRGNGPRGRDPRRLDRRLRDDIGVSEFFLAAVVVAIVGNAAEHGGAVLVAYRGKIGLAAEIALASSAQVAVFLIRPWPCSHGSSTCSRSHSVRSARRAGRIDGAGRHHARRRMVEPAQGDRSARRVSAGRDLVDLAGDRAL